MFSVERCRFRCDTFVWDEFGVLGRQSANVKAFMQVCWAKSKTDNQPALAAVRRISNSRRRRRRRHHHHSTSRRIDVKHLLTLCKLICTGNNWSDNVMCECVVGYRRFSLVQTSRGLCSSSFTNTTATSVVAHSHALVACNQSDDCIIVGFECIRAGERCWLVN